MSSAICIYLSGKISVGSNLVHICACVILPRTIAPRLNKLRSVCVCVRACVCARVRACMCVHVLVDARARLCLSSI